MSTPAQATSTTDEPDHEKTLPAGQLSPSSNPIGWYGKLPAAGDFLVRRLPDEFRNPWDRWLSEGMVLGKATLAEQWENVFLCFPVWRFLWHGARADRLLWTGLLMPGADRVGRLFPLTVAMPLELAQASATDARRALTTMPVSEGPVRQRSLAGLDDYLDTLQALALQVLQDDDIAGFDSAIRLLPGFDASTEPTPGQGLTAWFESRGLNTFLAEPATTVFWSRDPLVLDPIRVETCPPAASSFVRLVSSLPAADSCSYE